MSVIIKGGSSSDLATVKPANTAPVTTDTALVVSISPNSTLALSSGTVTANIGTTNGLALDATLTGGTQKTKLIDGAGTNLASVSAAGAIKTDSSATTQPISVVALPLPAGAATAAKQPSLGTAGASSADVLTMQGAAGMTPIKVDGTATTQPISAAALPLPAGSATSANQTTLGSQTTKLNDGTSSAVLKTSGVAASTTDVALVVAVSPNNTPVLPTGAATSALQTSANTILNTIATNTGASSVDFTQAGAIAVLAGTVVINGQGVYTISASVTGTWVGTLVTEGQLADNSWVQLPMYQVTSTLPYNAVFTTTTNGTFIITGGGYLNVRMRASVYTSGTINVALDGSLSQQTAFMAQLGAWSNKITDGTNTAVVKSGSTPAAAADVSLVVALSPNSPVKATIKPLYGANNQALTITLASLTNTSTRGCTAVSNTTNLFEDVLLSFKFTTAAAGTSATGYINVFGYASIDAGTTYTESFGGVDAAVTLTVPANAVLLTQINAVANGVTYRAGPVSFCRMMGMDTLPTNWGVFVQNESGATLNATAGNHAVIYQGVNGQFV